ncbi:MAG: phosphoesterase [Acidobacteria bacterium]|nr:MAG: phosphoesterase [Acidobacteriota bacterium]
MNPVEKTFSGASYYDIIGDIHGHASELHKLLQAMGYQNSGHTYAHPSRKVLFLGDYIDRGPEIAETLHLVKNMIDSGQAVGLLGNHEYNFICMHKTDANGSFLREHSPKNCDQTRETIKQLTHNKEPVEQWLQWMLSLPLLFETSEFRAIHACWSQSWIDFVTKQLGEDLCLTESFLQKSAKKGQEQDAIEILLKGPELELPDKYRFKDSDGHIRNSMRLKWWVEPRQSSLLNELTFTKAEIGKSAFRSLDDKTRRQLKTSGYLKSEKPVFFGHYADTSGTPIKQENVACLDAGVYYPEGTLTCYRWDGSRSLNPNNTVSLKSKALSSQVESPTSCISAICSC